MSTTFNCTYEQAAEIMDICEQKGYTKKGKIQDKMREAIKDCSLDLERYNAAIERFEQIIKPVETKPPITDASRNVTVRLNKITTCRRNLRRFGIKYLKRPPIA